MIFTKPRFFLALFLISYIFIAAVGLLLGQTEMESLFGTSSKYEKIRVEKVTSADTFVLENGEVVTLIGLKAPEPPPRKKIERDTFGFVIEKSNPVVSIETRSFNFARTLLEGKYIRLEFDTQKKDENFHTLAYAFLLDQTFVNEEILRHGFAHLEITPTNKKYVRLLREAYQEARREKRGLQSQ